MVCPANCLINSYYLPGGMKIVILDWNWLVFDRLDIDDILVLFNYTPGIRLSPHSILNRVVEIFMNNSLKSNCRTIQIGHESLAKYLPYHCGEYTLEYSTDVSLTMTQILWDDLYDFMELVIGGRPI